MWVRRKWMKTLQDAVHFFTVWRTAVSNPGHKRCETIIRGAGTDTDQYFNLFNTNLLLRFSHRRLTQIRVQFRTTRKANPPPCCPAMGPQRQNAMGLGNTRMGIKMAASRSFFRPGSAAPTEVAVQKRRCNVSRSNLFPRLHVRKHRASPLGLTFPNPAFSSLISMWISGCKLAVF